jgi:hypothetical protein
MEGGWGRLEDSSRALAPLGFEWIHDTDNA